MKKTEFSYSSKNIPMPSRMEYQKVLMDKVEKFLGRVRWKLFWIRNTEAKKEKLKTYGFRSTKYLPTSRELREFDNDMVDLITQIEIKFCSNTMQKKMNEDKQKIKTSTDIIIPAYKTGNFYQVDLKMYQKSLTDTITRDYRKGRGLGVGED